jgi:CrcB protein
VIRFLLVCLGGAVGTGARYALSVAAAAVFGTAFPVGTLVVNVLGSFLLGAIMELSLAGTAIGPDARLVIGTGIMGGFTTYSTFNYESLALLRDGAWALALANILATLAGCLLAGTLGLAAGRALSGAWESL